MFNRVTQEDLIVIYQQLKSDLEGSEQTEVRGHYEHIMLGLRRLIESHGPTELYQQWLVQFDPEDAADQKTLIVDL